MTKTVQPPWHTCIPQPKDCLIMIGLPGGAAIVCNRAKVSQPVCDVIKRGFECG